MQQHWLGHKWRPVSGCPLSCWIDQFCHSTSTIPVTLILVPDRGSGTNSCKIATTRSEFYAIYVIYLYYTSDSRLYTYSTVSFFLLMPPKDLAPFLIKVSKVIKYELTIDCIWLYTQPAMCIASFFSYIYPQKTSFNDKVWTTLTSCRWRFVSWVQPHQQSLSSAKKLPHPRTLTHKACCAPPWKISFINAVKHFYGCQWSVHKY